MNYIKEFNDEHKAYKQWENMHLSKFQDLDNFLIETKKVVDYYFNNQNDFKNKEDFIKYLKEQIIFYVNSYSLTRKEKVDLRERINFIDETYDKLIYYWEENPVEARRQRVKNKKISWEKWKIRWYFWKILKN